ncbi:MAG: hypothetical protein ACYTGG_02315 [Planctomycetota bacterium]|jgi:hypothetical protein
MTTQRLPTIAALAASILGASETVMASDADLDARAAEYRQEMSRLQEREQRREQQAEAERQRRRLHDDRVAQLRNRQSRLEGASLTEAAALGRFELESTATTPFDLWPDRPGVSLGMLQDGQPAAPSEAGAPPEAGAAAHGHESLAEAATNPIASLIQLQFQNNYIGESKAGDGTSNVFTIQPVIPWKIGELQMVSRLTLPLLVATPDLGDPIGREYGLGDLVALNAMVFNIDDGPWKGMYGPIGSFTIPTATSDFTGEGKFQAGPGFIYLNLATKGVQWGIMGYQQWSFASAGGDSGRDEVSKLFIQPVLNFHFEGGWYIGLQDILWSIDWNDDARWSLPTGMRFGRVTKLGKQPVNFFVQPWYDLSGNNKGNEWGIKLNVTILFPTG